VLEGVRKAVRSGVRNCALLSALLACGKKDTEQPPKDFSNPAAPAQPAPAKFALADFRTLRYLEGVWKGTMPNGKSFYESYHFMNDSTIFQANHTDSTLKTKSDSSLIVLRAGAVIDSGSGVSTAEKIDSAMIDFRSAPTYHFTWMRQSNDAWTARLYTKQPDGTERVTTYPMKRIRR